MITGFFLQIFYILVAFFVNLLPTTAFPSGITNAITTVWYYVNSMSFLLPVSTLLQVLVLAMIFHGAILLWRLAHLVGGYIRGK